jgi:hypothetical protein
MRSNCFFFAVALRMRRAKTNAKRRKKRDGKRQLWIGYVSVRTSFWGPFFHFLYQERRPYGTRFISFVPLKPSVRKIPPLLFEGRIKWGDGPPQR